MDQLDPFLAFLKISTNLELSLNLLNSLLMCGKESTLMKEFSSKLPSVCRRLLVTGLRLDALDKPDKTQSPRDVALALLGRLLEICGGKWILDPAADNNPLKICARVACGEVRTEYIKAIVIPIILSTDTPPTPFLPFLAELTAFTSLVVASPQPR